MLSRYLQRQRPSGREYILQLAIQGFEWQYCHGERDIQFVVGSGSHERHSERQSRERQQHIYSLRDRYGNGSQRIRLHCGCSRPTRKPV